MAFSYRLFPAALALLGVIALSGSALSQTIQYVLGDPIPGGGSVTNIQNLDVNNSGEWLIGGNNSFTGSVFTNSSGLLWTSGQPTPTPSLPGATYVRAESARLNNRGDLAANLRITAPVSVYDLVNFNSTQVFEEGDNAAAMTGATPASSWALVWQVYLNDARQLLVHGGVDDPMPGVPTPFDAVLTRLQLDSNGAIQSSVPILLEDDPLPGVGAGLFDSLEIDANQMDMNDAGEVIFTAKLKNAANGEWATYLWSGGVFTKLAEEGSPTPFDPSRSWRNLALGVVDLNDSGDYVHLCGLGGSTTQSVIVKNGTVFRASGDPVPGMAPNTFYGSLGGDWVKIDSAGNVLHYGWWNDPNPMTRRGIFLNDELLLQEGVSTLEGVTIERLYSQDNGVAMSDNGRYLLFRALLVDGRAVVGLLDRGGADAFCFGDGGASPGCTNCPCGNNALAGSDGGCINSFATSARLVSLGSASATTAPLRFMVEDATGGPFGILMSADNQLPNMGACPPGSGIAAPVFDGLRCVGGAVLRHGTRATDSNGDIGIANNGWGPPHGPPGGIAANGGFVSGQTRHFQCVYRETPLAGCGTGQNTTNALSVTF